ncbi:hypothetical protein [Pseudonocardia broussonetiae]|uniref:Uncharacterized protein n=1 Tax=Pseudonocardia broussonetiae TaxID=2736640 RepID=A0A6M6JK39_9PSEU|nr:hypothetical protein [Pseudonocardia broussonetiae]QJY47533.1 hypothetical protein HOP40_18355 [Pseudonocardia broussonetiae]
MGLFRRTRRFPLDRRGGLGPGSPRGRFGLWGPVPYYSRRTRGGADVSVGGCGCCLPIPLLVATGTVGGVRALWRRLR